jgi:hypothetical protein
MLQLLVVALVPLLVQSKQQKMVLESQLLKDQMLLAAVVST